MYNFARQKTNADTVTVLTPVSADPLEFTTTISVTCPGTAPTPGRIVTWKTHCTDDPIPVLVAAVMTFTKGPPATPARIWMLDGAAAPGAQLEVASVMATCAWLILRGVESMNGNRAPGANPANRALSEISCCVGGICALFSPGKRRAKAITAMPLIANR